MFIISVGVRGNLLHRRSLYSGNKQYIPFPLFVNVSLRITLATIDAELLCNKNPMINRSDCLEAITTVRIIASHV